MLEMLRAVILLNLDELRAKHFIRDSTPTPTDFEYKISWVNT